MPKSISKVLISGALSLVCAGTAQAKVIYETFSSNIDNGYDAQGRFGPKYHSLNGDRLTVQYKVDLGAGGVFITNGPNSTEYAGGPGSFMPAPTIMEITVTVNRVSSFFGVGSNYSALFNYRYVPSGGSDSLIVNSHDNGPSFQSITNTESGVYSNTTDFLMSSAIGAPTNFTSLPGDGAILVNDSNGFYALTGVNSIIHVIVGTTPVSVPAPASLALLGLGAGTIAARRRRR